MTFVGCDIIKLLCVIISVTMLLGNATLTEALHNAITADYEYDLAKEEQVAMASLDLLREKIFSDMESDYLYDQYGLTKSDLAHPLSLGRRFLIYRLEAKMNDGIVSYRINPPLNAAYIVTCNGEPATFVYSRRYSDSYESEGFGLNVRGIDREIANIENNGYTIMGLLKYHYYFYFILFDGQSRVYFTPVTNKEFQAISSEDFSGQIAAFLKYESENGPVYGGAGLRAMEKESRANHMPIAFIFGALACAIAVAVIFIVRFLKCPRTGISA